MNLLFIADPLETFKTYKDSTYAMMVEATRRGHTINAMLAGDLVWKAEWVVGRTQRVFLPSLSKGGGSASENPPQPPFGKGGGTHTTPWFERGEAEWHDLASFDAVVMRTDPPFDQAYLYATWLLEMAERQGARVFNSPRALRDYNEKLAIARYPRFIAPTLVTCHADLIREFLTEQGDIVVKPLNAMGGAMVFRLRPDDANVGAILEAITQYGRETVMAQRYLPEIKAGDKRILVIAGQPVPYCLARIPAAGETRGNLAAGGNGVAQPLSEHDWEIARALGPELHAAGLLLVGLDVIGDCLTEVNVTSPTCFQEITQQTGFNVAGMFIDALEREVNDE